MIMSTSVQVKLLRVDNEKTCVEFTCKGGSKQFFYNQYTTLLEKLDNLNDTVM
jgi:hypothetical protein